MLKDGADSEWEIEEILDAKMRYRSLWYYVRFKGYNESHDKWVKHSDVFTNDTITNFYWKHPEKPWQINQASFDSIPFRDPSADIRTIRTLRPGAAIQGGGDVRGTPLHCHSTSEPRTSAPSPNTELRPPDPHPILSSLHFRFPLPLRMRSRT